MNKVISLFVAVLLATALNCHASGLVPTNIYPIFSGSVVYHPIYYFSFSFDGEIGAVEGVTSALVCEGDTIAKASATTSNYTYNGHTQGTANFEFEDGIFPPLGKSYTFTVVKDAIFLIDSANVTNDELTIDFSVPTNLPSPRYGSAYHNNDTIVSKSSFMWSFPTETEVVKGAEMTLFRKDVPIRSYTSDGSWDWDLGTVNMRLTNSYKDEIHFEKDVPYSILMPEGMVYALYRPEIVNKEEVTCFVGGSDVQFNDIRHTWCSLSDNHPGESLGEVNFRYDRAIALSLDPKLMLCAANGEAVKEATPILEEQNGVWVMTADFEDYPLDPQESYHIVIPESTVVAHTGNPEVNLRTEVALDGTAGLADTVIDKGADEPVYDLQGRRVNHPAPGQLVIQGGKKMIAK